MTVVWLGLWAAAECAGPGRDQLPGVAGSPSRRARPPAEAAARRPADQRPVRDRPSSPSARRSGARVADGVDATLAASARRSRHPRGRRPACLHGGCASPACSPTALPAVTPPRARRGRVPARRRAPVAGARPRRTGRPAAAPPSRAPGRHARRRDRRRPFGLTDEADVLRLLALARTNREIGGRAVHLAEDRERAREQHLAQAWSGTAAGRTRRGSPGSGVRSRRVALPRSRVVLQVLVASRATWHVCQWSRFREVGCVASPRRHTGGRPVRDRRSSRGGTAATASHVTCSSTSASAASPAGRAVGLADCHRTVEPDDRRVGEPEQLVVPLHDLDPVGLLDTRPRAAWSAAIAAWPGTRRARSAPARVGDGDSLGDEPDVPQAAVLVGERHDASRPVRSCSRCTMVQEHGASEPVDLGVVDQGRRLSGQAYRLGRQVDVARVPLVETRLAPASPCVRLRGDRTVPTRTVRLARLMRCAIVLSGTRYTYTICPGGEATHGSEGRRDRRRRCRGVGAQEVEGGVSSAMGSRRPAVRCRVGALGPRRRGRLIASCSMKAAPRRP